MNAADRQLFAAYAATTYDVTTEHGLTRLRVGHKCVALDTVLRGTPALGNAWTFVTAWNPFSEPLPAAENSARNRELEVALRQCGTRVYEAQGREFIDGSGWDEDGFVALGVGRAEAVELGRRFGQNAVLWCEVDGPVELVDSRPPTLAQTLARNAVAGVVRTEPNYMSEEDEAHGRQKRRVEDVHPSFCGCYDWHSAVHSHWLLVRLLRSSELGEELSAAAALVLDGHFTEDAMQQEVKALEENDEWETPYGLAWVLCLKRELDDWAAAEASNMQVVRWCATVGVLEATVLPRFTAWLRLLAEPNRGGMHQNTAFSLSLALDFARCEHSNGDRELEDLVCSVALRFYADETDAVDSLSVDGRGHAAFLSDSLTVADLMRRVLEPSHFVQWLDRCYPRPQAWTPDGDADPEDRSLTHLVGLNFSRSWCLSNLATAIAAAGTGGAEMGEPAALRRMAAQHLAIALPMVVSGGWMGDHWLHTFALLAVEVAEGASQLTARL